jgi:hypothetical protein
MGHGRACRPLGRLVPGDDEQRPVFPLEPQDALGQLSEAPEKNKVRYEMYKDELESRDPTSIEFNPAYAKYVNREKPHDLVEPPAAAQKFLKDSPYADPIVSNAKLKAEIARLRKVLKLR